ncbi:hypothetical protein EYC84_005965 [Monilinia fructicola]|uniref:Uncharacterized protein n=1 Tax=Monilinia fructicola TaxID=38448 RepID=A0A5M9JZ57_MONFR|nr:hypothetical protein EYC84_005965 [Monilinia fructicola]
MLCIESFIRYLLAQQNIIADSSWPHRMIFFLVHYLLNTRSSDTLSWIFFLSIDVLIVTMHFLTMRLEPAKRLCIPNNSYLQPLPGNLTEKPVGHPQFV